MSKNSGAGSISERLLLIREGTGLSQDKFSASIGVSLRTYSRYESGEREPDVSVLLALHNQYGVDLNWFIAGDGSSRSSELTNNLRQQNALLVEHNQLLMKENKLLSQ